MLEPIIYLHKMILRGGVWGSNQLIFAPKWCHVDLALICHFLVFHPHLKAMGPIYGSHPIGLLHFIGP
jgi:hypothetical protein